MKMILNTKENKQNIHKNMKNNKLTFEQFYKANKQRRQELTKRFGYSSVTELMNFLKKNKQGTSNLKKGPNFSTYEEFNNLSKSLQLALANQAGYKTVAAYKSKLRSQFGKTKTTTASDTNTFSATNSEAVTVNNIFLLDESGSMSGSKYTNMVKGVNESFVEFKNFLKDNPQVTMKAAVVRFDSNTQNCRTFDLETVNQNSVAYPFKGILGGMTALNDAVYYTLKRLLSLVKTGEKTVLQIFTDGGENCSHHTSLDVRTIIEKAEAVGVTVTFVGTQYDVNITNNLYNLKKGNSLVHENTAKSIGETFRKMSASTVSYTKAVMDGQDVSTNFYSKVLIDETK